MTVANPTSSTRRARLPPILFVTGGPGAGKGTQCALLTEEFGADVRGEDGSEPAPSAPSTVATAASRSSSRSFGVVHISVGAVLRRASSLADALSPADRELIVSTLAAGGILPGNLTVQLLHLEFQRLMEAQARINPHLRLVFVVDGFPRTMDNVREFESRLGPIEDILLLECDDADMLARLEQRGRADDQPDIIRRRISGFYTQTMPVVDWFARRVAKSQAAGTQSTGNLPAASAACSTASSTGGASSPVVAYDTSPRLLVVDGRPPIAVVWKEVCKAFAQFLATKGIENGEPTRNARKEQ